MKAKFPSNGKVVLELNNYEVQQIMHGLFRLSHYYYKKEFWSDFDKLQESQLVEKFSKVYDILADDIIVNFSKIMDKITSEV